jgi:hypothetical protein
MPRTSSTRITSSPRPGFEWQSQNRTGQASADGQDIENHAARGVAVHLPCARLTRYQDLTFLVMLFGGGMT